MSGTRRTPLERRPVADFPITERMVDAYARMLKLPECTCPKKKDRPSCPSGARWYPLLTVIDSDIPAAWKRANPWRIPLCCPCLVLTADGTWRQREPFPDQAELEARLHDALAARDAKAKTERALARAAKATKEKPPDAR